MSGHSAAAASASTTADREIVITRVLEAPRELVFAAWTDPTHVERWWGPHGYASSDCEVDLRAGGVFRLQMRGPDGALYPCKGLFREVVVPERIVFAAESGGGHACGAGLPPGAVVTVTFVENEGKTTLTIHTRVESAEARDAIVQAGYEPGWSQSLERLAAYLGAMA